MGEGYSCGMTMTMAPEDLIPVNGVDDAEKLSQLVASMTAHGWNGAPIVADLGIAQALTGSHRLAAAEAAGIEAPVVDIRDLCADHDLDWDLLVEERGDWYEAARWLDHYLPSDVSITYGLDIH